MQDTRRQGVEQIFSLGDVINGVDPHGCITRLRQWQAEEQTPLVCIKGNGELYLLTPDLDALPSRGHSWEQSVLALIRWFHAQLTPEDLDWLATLPDYLIRDGVCLVHDSPQDRLMPETWRIPDLALQYQEWFHHARGLSEDLPEAEWQKLLDLMEDRHFSRVFCGHTHQSFVRWFGSRVVCNAGSVGAPLDGDPRAVWALVEELPGSGSEALRIEIQRVDYDVNATQRLIDQAVDYPDFQRPGYRERYKQWFATGNKIVIPLRKSC